MDREAVAAVAALDDEVRRALFQFVRSAREPVTREAAADAVGVSRKLAAFHLDKLVTLGLLQSGFASGGSRRVGRTPRVYEAARRDITVHVPERTPEVLAAILVAALTGQRADERAEDSALRVARGHGAELGAAARADAGRSRMGVERATAVATELLARAGFEPYRSGAAVRLHNCPFHPLAAGAPDLVCGLNREYVGGLLDGLGVQTRLSAELAPLAGECCVEIRPTA
jgi:predicted ArsR family transcriptional regulator